MKVLRQRQRVLETSVHAVEGIKNPELRIRRLSTALPEPGQGGLSLRVRWSPPFPGALRARRVQAAALARAGAFALQLSLYETVAKARELYARLRRTQQQIVLQRQLAAIHERRLEHHRKGARLGTYSKLKMDLSRLRQLDLQRKLGALKVTRARLRGRLLGLLELRPSKGQSLISLRSGDRSGRSDVPPLKALVRETLARHPSLLALGQRLRAQHAAVWLEKAKRYPWLSFVQVAYDFGEDRVQDRILLGLGFRLPVFNQNSGRVQLRQQQFRLLKTRRRALRLQLAGAVEARFRAVQATYHQLRRFEQVTRPQIKSILSRATIASGQQGVDLEEVFRVQSTALRLEMEHLGQRLSYQLARIQLDLVSVRPVWRDYGIRLARR